MQTNYRRNHLSAIGTTSIARRAAIFVLLLAATVLPACSGASTPGSANPQATAAPAEPAIAQATPAPTQTPAPAAIPTSTPVADEPLERILARAATIKSMKYDMAIQVTSVPGQKPDTGRVWFSGNRVRIEPADEEKSKLFFSVEDLDARLTYEYSVAENKVVKTEMSGDDADSFPYAGRQMARWFAASNPTLVGAATIDGKQCLKIRGQASNGIAFQAWIWKEYGFPVRMELADGGRDLRIEWKNLDFVSVPDALFQPPPVFQTARGSVGIDSLTYEYAEKDSDGNHLFRVEAAGTVKGPPRAYMNLFVPSPWLMSPNRSLVMPSSLAESVQWIPLSAPQWTRLEEGRFIKREEWAPETSRWSSSGVLKIPASDFAGRESILVEMTAWVSVPPDGLLASEVWWRAFSLP